jgi:hypothetical protein
LVHVTDLDVFRYHGGPFEPQNWAVPLRAVGWLEHPQPFTTGKVTSTAIPKLKAMVEQTRSAYSQYNFRGTKSCSFCLVAGLPDPGPIWSQENVFVPSAGVVFVAPGGIVHYIEAHSYLPPHEFVEAVLQCPDCRSIEYREALSVANGGIEPPIETAEEFRMRIHQQAAAAKLAREREKS